MPLKSYVVAIGPANAQVGYTWRGPDDLYDGIKAELGVQDLAQFNGPVVTGRTGSFVPRLRIYAEDQNGVGRSYLVFCDPGSYESAVTSLIGKAVRGRTIRRVKFPKKRVFV